MAALVEIPPGTGGVCSDCPSVLIPLAISLERDVEGRDNFPGVSRYLSFVWTLLARSCSIDYFCCFFFSSAQLSFRLFLFSLLIRYSFPGGVFFFFCFLSLHHLLFSVSLANCYFVLLLFRPCCEASVGVLLAFFFF